MLFAEVALHLVVALGRVSKFVERSAVVSRHTEEHLAVGQMHIVGRGTVESLVAAVVIDRTTPCTLYIEEHL